MAGKMTRSNFVELLYPGYHDIFFDNYGDLPMEASQVFDMISHNEYFMKKGRMMGLGPFQNKAVGDFISLDAGKWLSDKEVFFPTYALGYGVTWELLEDDRYGEIEKFAAELGKSAQVTKELLSFDVLNNATGTDEVGLDGKAMLANDHLTGDGVTTIDNLSAAALSQTALEDGLEYFETLVNERSEPRPFKGPKLLLIPPQLKWKAKELLLSEYKPEFVPGDYTATALDTRNSINVLADEDISYMVVHWFTKTDCWFLIDKKYNDLIGVNRRNVTFDKSKDPNNGDGMYYSTFRYKPTFFDFRGITGYPGA